MRATGIVRKLDDLGRLCIPKELRQTTGINEGDFTEIFTDENGVIILKRHESLCIFCGGLEGVKQFRGKNICPKCVRAISATVPS